MENRPSGRSQLSCPPSVVLNIRRGLGLPPPLNMLFPAPPPLPEGIPRPSFEPPRGLPVPPPGREGAELPDAGFSAVGARNPEPPPRICPKMRWMPLYCSASSSSELVELLST